MLDPLLAIGLALCWILGFFLLASVVFRQHK